MKAFPFVIGILASFTALAAPIDFNAAQGAGTNINGTHANIAGVAQIKPLSGPFFDPVESEITMENIVLVSESDAPGGKKRLGFTLGLRNTGEGYYEALNIEWEPASDDWHGVPVADLIGLPDLEPNGSCTRPQPFEVIVPAAERDAAVADILAGKRLRPDGRELFRYSQPAVSVDEATDDAFTLNGPADVATERYLYFATNTALLQSLHPGMLLVEGPAFYALRRPDIPPPLEVPEATLSSVVHDASVFGPIDKDEVRSTTLAEVLEIAPNNDGVRLRVKLRRLEDMLTHGTFTQTPADAFDEVTDGSEYYFPKFGDNALSQYVELPNLVGKGPRNKDRIKVEGFRAQHFPINDIQIFNGLTVDGQILLDALNIEIKARFRGRLLSGLTPKHLSLKLAAKSELTLRLIADAQAGNKNQPLVDKEKQLFNVALPRITFYIGNIPIEIEPNLKGKVGVEIDAPTRVIIPVQAGIEVGSVMSWDDSRPQGQKYRYKSFKKERPLTMSDPLLNNSLAFTASVFAEAALDVKINHVVGPYMAARATATFELDPTDNPWWSIGVDVNTFSRFRGSFFGLDLNDAAEFAETVGRVFDKNPGGVATRGSGVPGGTAPGSFDPVSGGDSRWLRKLGGAVSGMRVAPVSGTASEDVFAVGNAVTNPPIMRIGAKGDVIWAKTLGGYNPERIVSKSNTLTMVQGGFDALIARINSDGSFISGRRFQPLDSVNARQVFYIGDILIGPGGEMYLVGSVNDFVTGEDVFVAKYNSSLAIEWCKRFSLPNTAEVVNGAVMMPDGDIVLCGACSGDVDAAQNPHNLFRPTGGLLMRIRPDGTVEWAERVLTGMRFSSVVVSDAGILYTAGHKDIDVLVDWPTLMVGIHDPSTGEPRFLATVGENMAGANPVVPGVTRDWLARGAGLSPYDEATKAIWTPNGLVVAGNTVGYFANNSPGLDPATRAPLVMCFSEQMSLRWWTTHDAGEAEDRSFDIAAVGQGIFTAGSSGGFGNAPDNTVPAMLGKLPWDGKLDFGASLPGQKISKFLLPCVMQIPQYGNIRPGAPVPDDGYAGVELLNVTVVDQNHTSTSETLVFSDIVPSYSTPQQLDPRDPAAVRRVIANYFPVTQRTSAVLTGIAYPNRIGGNVRFEYGTSADALTNLSTPVRIPATGVAVPFEITIRGLTEGTTYYYRARMEGGGQPVLFSSTLNFRAINSPPDAVDDTGFQVVGPGTILLPLLANDTDAEGDSLIIDTVTNPLRGSAVISPDGKSVLYTPDPNEEGHCFFTYRVTDGTSTDTANVDLFLSPTQPRPTALVLTALAATGDPVPDATVAGAFIQSFGTPAISDTGAIVATIATRAGRTPGTGIYFQDAGGAVTRLARSGGLAPGLGIATFAAFGDPSISPRGAIAFTAKIAGSGVNSRNDDGLWTTLGGGLRRIVAESGTLPFLGASRVSQIASFSIRDGEILALLKLQRGQGVNDTNDTALVRIFPDGSGSVLARDGAQVSAGDTAIVQRISALSPAIGSPGHGRSHGDAGSIAKLIVANDRAKLVRFLPDGTADPLITAGNDAPAVGNDIKWAGFGLPAQTIDGTAFTTLASLKRRVGGVTPQTDSALLFRAYGNPLEVIARTGDPAVGPDTTFAAFLDPVLNNDWKVAFQATLRGTGVTRRNAASIWYGDPASPSVIARAGDSATDSLGQSIGDTVWTAFPSYALPEGGGPVFLGQVSGDGVNSANRTGLWARSSTGELLLLLRTGDSLSAGGRLRRVASIATLSAANGPFGATRSFNATGSLVARVTFTDRTDMLVQFDIP